MDARTRVLTALDGGIPDRIPCALGIYPVDLDALLPGEACVTGGVDVVFVRFDPAPDEERWRKVARITPDDTRLGTLSQVSNYAKWTYHPRYPGQRNPLARATSLKELEDFTFPEINISQQVKVVSRSVAAYHTRGMAVGCGLPHLGGELFEAAWRLRGLENFLLDLVERPAWAHLLLERLAAMASHYAEAVAQTDVDILVLGDDIGMPGTMMIGPESFRTFFKSRLAQIIQTARESKPELRVVYHSDGVMTPVLFDLMEIGVNAINPLQADHMNAEHIRQLYGPALAFWGTVGSQTTFSFATPDAIKLEVKTRIEQLGPAGLILSPAYDIDEPDIKWQNIAAFLDAVHQYGVVNCL